MVQSSNVTLTQTEENRIANHSACPEVKGPPASFYP